MSNEVPHCQSLEEIANSIRAQMESSNSAREEALKICREVIQLCSRTIRAIHREEMTNAQTLLAEAKNRVERAKSVLKEHPDLLHAGYVHDSQKEYVEAETMLAIVTGQPIPPPEVMGVEPAAYLNGLAEAASESRRHVLDRLRLDDIAQAERVLKRMDDIYYELVTFDFPDAITGGLRRTTDALRAVLERTRADLTLTLSQKRLQSSLQSALERLSGSDNRVD